MTIENETSASGPYTGNGVTTSFAYLFRVTDSASLAVSVTSADGATITRATEGTDYTVAGVGAAEGTVTFTTAPAVGEKVVISLEPALLQPIDLISSGAFDLEVIEAALDLLLNQAKRLAYEMDRSIHAPVGEVLDMELAPAASRAGRILWFDDDGLPTTAPSLADENRALLAALILTGGDVDAAVLDIWNRVNVLEGLWPDDTIMTLTAVQTATNKTLTAPVLTAPVLDDTATGSAILTDAGLTGASSDTLASSQAIVDYVAAQGFAIGYGTIDDHDFASDGATFAVTDIREADFEFEMEGVTATTFTVSFSDDNGATWDSAITLASSITANSGIGRVRGMTDSTRKTLVELTHSAAAGASAGVVRLQPTAQPENAIRFGGIEAGKIYMRRVASNVPLNDPLWEDVALLIQGGFVTNQGFLGQPAFVDLSPDARTITHDASGGTTAVGVITSSSIAFTDAGAGNDDINWPHDTRLDPGAGPFSWEWAFILTGVPAYRMGTFTHWGPTNPEKSYYLFVDPNGDLGIVYRTSIGGADNTITFAAGLTSGTEYRCAIVINDLGVVTCNVNGVAVGAPTPLVGAIVAGGDATTGFGERADGGGDPIYHANRLRMTGAARTDFSELGLFLAR